MFKNKRSIFILLTYILPTTCYLLSLSGCAPTAYVKPVPPAALSGIYHRVERGQTLWRISKVYNIDLDELVGVNHITDMTAIEVGQLIFIPNRRTTQEVIPAKYSSDDFIWPIRGRIIAGFGKTYNNMINKGLNIQPHSNLDVIASRSGRVVFYADAFGSFGKTIIIEHGDGLSTVYARNEQVFIKAGQNVEKGAMIARVGSAGRDRNTYLHFEIRKGHIPQNPYFYLP